MEEQIKKLCVNVVQDFTENEKAQGRDNLGVDLSTLATKTELNAKQDTLTAGTGIDITNNVISATGGGSGGGVFIATYNSTTYDDIADAIAAGDVVFLRYGGADIPISSSTDTRHAFLQVRRDGHSYAQQSDSTRVFVVSSSDTWEMNSVPVAYNVIAGGGLSYNIIDNDLTLSVSASFMPDLSLLTQNTVNVTGNTTLNIEAGNAYNIRVTNGASPIITLSTTSINTIHSLITVKNESATSCSEIVICYNDETGYQHDIDLEMHETSTEYDFYVDIRKVGNTVIARVYDLPCMYRKAWMGSPSYQNDTAWIGYST